MIGSSRSEVGLPAGMEILRNGGRALDAVEHAMWLCEDNLDDHYVGTGGLPNAQGVVELDASVMVGSDRRFGAVGALQGFRHPISVARGVLEHLPQHCLLVGEGAALFAAERDYERTELLTDAAREIYQHALEGEDTGSSTAMRPGKPENELYRTTSLALMERLGTHDGPWGTINILALDETGELVVGVSTSGFPWKYPGRIGDSALPGTGIYADARFGGAACTGRGEMTMRICGARAVVDGLERGLSPNDACRAMVADAATLIDPFASDVRTLCLLPDGRHGGASIRSGATYMVMGANDDEPWAAPAVSL